MYDENGNFDLRYHYMIDHRIIAKIAGSRNDNVKRTLDRLKDRGIISITPLEERIPETELNATIYYTSRRDSIVTIAQLKPQVTAQLVDCWDEFE